jgi:branched-chain amino acid transport system permease protein
MTGLRQLVPILVFAAAYAALALGITNSYYQLMMTLVLVWAIFGLSWNMLSGYTGLVSFGHAAFFASAPIRRRSGESTSISPWILIDRVRTRRDRRHRHP